MGETPAERLARIKAAERHWNDSLDEDDLLWLIEQAENVPQWIPVSERLPEEIDFYQTWDGHEVAPEWYDPDLGWPDDTFGNITHWMPLPSPPEADE